jgi:hypothetical protein
VKALVLATLCGCFILSARTAPLLITAPGVYGGSFDSTDPNVPAITIEASPVTLYNVTVQGPGTLIDVRIPYADLTMQNCWIHGKHSPFNGEGNSVGLAMSHPWALAIRSCSFDHCRSFILLNGYNDGLDPRITIWASSFLEHETRAWWDGAYGQSTVWGPGIWIANIHSDRVHISWCDFITKYSYPGDTINVYSSQGYYYSPIDISFCYLEGCVPIQAFVPGAVWNANGFVTDDPMSNHQGYTDSFHTTAWVAFHDNLLVRSQAAIWAGHHNTIYGNTAVFTGKTPTGQYYNFWHSGINSFSPEVSAWSDTNIVRDNLSGCVNPLNGSRNDYYCPAGQINNNQSLPDPITPELEGSIYSAIREPDLDYYGITVGPK